MPLTAYSITPNLSTRWADSQIRSAHKEIYNQTFTQDLAPGDYVLRRVQDQIDLLHYLKTVGLKIGTPLPLKALTLLHYYTA